MAKKSKIVREFHLQKKVQRHFELRKELKEEVFGTFHIKIEGIKNPEKVDIAYERATQYTFGALMGDDDIEQDGDLEDSRLYLKSNTEIYATNSENIGETVSYTHLTLPTKRIV